jgi:type IV secretory pathway VirB2 component (pilin)
MPLSTFERVLPWTGAIAGLAWIGQAFLFRVDTEDYPGKASTAVIRDHLGQNYAAVGCLVIMGIALVFFASALRSQLRSGEAREATYSNVAYGGVLLASAGLSQMVMWNWGLINGAADAKDDAALHVLSFVGYFGFAGMGIGLATMFIATGLAGVRNHVLPRWFAIVTVVMGILSALGAAGIPPGGLVNYLLLPFWLIGTAVIVARRQDSAGARHRPLTTHAL